MALVLAWSCCVILGQSSRHLIKASDVNAHQLHTFVLTAIQAEPVLGDNFKEVVDAALAAYDSGKLAEAVKDGPEGYKNWIKGVGKEMGRKGKRLFMPMRIAFTGSQEGPEVGEVLHLLSIEDGDVKDTDAYVPLAKRMDTLREWSTRQL